MAPSGESSTDQPWRRDGHDVDPALADPRDAVPIGQQLALVANDAGSGQEDAVLGRRLDGLAEKSLPRLSGLGLRKHCPRARRAAPIRCGRGSCRERPARASPASRSSALSRAWGAGRAAPPAFFTVFSTLTDSILTLYRTGGGASAATLSARAASSGGMGISAHSGDSCLGGSGATPEATISLTLPFARPSFCTRSSARFDYSRRSARP